jgi:hypothetical protein
MTEARYSVSIPTLQITTKAWDKLQAYSNCKLDKTFVEISGYLIGEQVAPDDFLIWDALLVPSSGTGGSTTMENEGTAKLIQKLMDSEDEEDQLRIKSMIGWWHVHPGGNGQFWSPQDDNQVEYFGDAGYDWLISVVLSHKDATYRARMDFFRPYKMSVDNVDLERCIPPGVQDIAQKEVDENVTRPKVQYRSGVVFPGHGASMPKNIPGGCKVTDKRRVTPTGLLTLPKPSWKEQVATVRKRLAREKKGVVVQ